MLDPTRQRGLRPPTAGPFPDGTYRLQIGDTFDSLAELFGLVDAQSYAAFARLNPELASGRHVPGGLVVLPPASSARVDEPPPEPGASVRTDWTEGYNRRLDGQNRFNDALEAAVRAWPELDPLVLKSMLAQESSFRARATNRYGYAGIAQLGIREARAAGLRTGASHMRGRTRPAYVDRARDERLDPSKEIPAAAEVMRRKADALDRGFKAYGRPHGDDYWRFVTAAYNGGEGTVLLAMKLAYGDSRPAEVSWDDLVTSPDGDARHTPLYRACQRYFGAMPATKYREISEYARDVLRRARQ
jgi:hypothetical protein